MGLAVIFPGQGTQSAGMGVAWRSTPSWSVVEQAEAALGEPLGRLLTDASDDDLTRTRAAQLAVFLTSLMAWEALRAEIDPPIAFAGHSLGQVSALVAAGALSLDDGVRLAARRAECTQQAADRTPGRMVALVGAGVEVAEAACEGVQGVWIANDNAPDQVVLSGTAQGVETASERARERGARRVVPLNVGGAFHTPLMAEAREAFVPSLEVTTFQRPSAPVVSNTDAEAWSDADEWRVRLAEHLVSPVRWRQSMETLVDSGADRFVEVGPGAVLSGLARRTVPHVDVRRVSSPADIGSFQEVA